MITGELNREFFGYICFVYLFFFIKPIVSIYNRDISFGLVIEKTISLIVLIYSLTLLQGLMVTSKMAGLIGQKSVEFSSSYIGSFGVFILAITAFVLSAIILLNYNYNKINYQIQKIKNSENRFKTLFKEFKYTFFKEDMKFQEKFKQNYSTQTKNETPDFDKLFVEQKIEEQSKKTLFDDNPFADEVHNFDEVISEDPTRSQYQDKKINTISKVVEENESLLSKIKRVKKEMFADYKAPKTSMLTPSPEQITLVDELEIDGKINDLLDKLQKFKIDGDVIKTYSGPIVTTFEFKPAPHIKVSKILNLQDDLAMTLRAKTIRIQAPVPGKDVVGIEIPNSKIDTIYLRDILESDIFQNSSNMTIALGKDIVGNPFITDLTQLPHLLIAGTTGSGKSVGINSMILSLLFKNSPRTLKLLMIDPKMLEFSIYNEIPHLLTPVITESKQAIIALSNMVSEMERRYKLMSESKTKNIESFNTKARKEKNDILPYIVVIIDELGDLMMTAGKDVEFYIARLAQMARASGIHLIVATQRPSVDVVTGLIKANLPSRISYRVGQKIDSKVILDALGAESLLGRGDMLFTPPGMSKIVRLHAPYASEEEIERIVEYLKSNSKPQYDTSFLVDEEMMADSNPLVNSVDFDELYEDAKKIVISEQKTSTSYIQRRLKIGYNRAARIIEQLENMGVLSAPDHKGQRAIL